MPTNIEYCRWAAGALCEVAGLDPVLLRSWRKPEYGLRGVGKFEAGGIWRYSALDVAEVTTAWALAASGYTQAEAIAQAHDLRGDLRNGLINRLEHGFWSLGAVEFAVDEVGVAHRTLYLDAALERVITKLKLPLPENPLPRSREVAARMTDAILDYVFSPPGIMRWQKWRTSALERGGKLPLVQSAAELGVPPWFLRGVLKAAPHENWVEVTPRAAEVVTRLEGVSLQ